MTCQSYQSGRICLDGFVQRPFCHGHGGCVICGNIPDSALPACLRDEIPEHLATATGAPLFYRGQQS